MEGSTVGDLERKKREAGRQTEIKCGMMVGSDWV